MATASQLQSWIEQIKALEARKMAIELGAVTSANFGQRGESYMTLDQIDDAIDHYRGRILQHRSRKGKLGPFRVATQEVVGGANGTPA